MREVGQWLVGEDVLDILAGLSTRENKSVKFGNNDDILISYHEENNDLETKQNIFRYVQY